MCVEEEKKRDLKQKMRETVCLALMITEPLMITPVSLNILVCLVINRSPTHTDLNTGTAEYCISLQMICI